MTEFARYFTLKDDWRQDFRLVPEKDGHIYVDLDGVVPKFRRELSTDAPKWVFEGDFGTGKSQILRHIEKVLAPQSSFDSFFIEISGLGRKSTFFDVHRKILYPGLLKVLLEALARSTEARRQEFYREFDDLPDLRKALSDLEHHVRLRSSTGRSKEATSWLIASATFTGAQARRAGYSALLHEVLGPSNLVDLYRQIARLHKEVARKGLILLLDESEGFSVVADPDAQAAIGAGLRGLFDSDNLDLGFLVGLTSPASRKGTHPMLRTDVRSRIGSRYTTLSPLSSPDRVRSFLTSLWPMLSAGPSGDPHPFKLSPDALEFVANRLDDLRRRVPISDQLSASPAPRDLLEVLTVLGKGAVEANHPPPIRADVIRRWFGLTGS